MNQSTQQQFNEILRQQGLQAGIKPVENIPSEKSRLEEVERLGVLEKDFSQIQITMHLHNLLPLLLALRLD